MGKGKRMKLILASASPRRRELLQMAGYDFRCLPAEGPEEIPEGMPAEEVPSFLAQQKAEEIRRCCPEDVVIGSDTIVCLGSEIMGKPADEEDAVRMLAELSGRCHRVITGVAVLWPDGREVFTSVAEVEFFPLDEQEIRAYVASGEPMDKAGAYGIQGLGGLLVSRINGDYYTIVGLPVGRTVRCLRKHFPGAFLTEGQ